MLQRVAKKDTVAAMWSEIKEEYESKTELVQANLRTRFYMSHCGEREDLRTHLDKLQTMYEELATVRITVSDAEYRSVIMQSLPKSYANYLSALTSSAHVSKVTLTPTTILVYLKNEYDHQAIDHKRSHEKPSKTRDVALYSQPKKASGPKAKLDKAMSKGFSGTCYNCDGTGHRAHDCPSPRQEKPKGDKNPPRDTENPEEEDPWADMPNLTDVSDSEDESEEHGFWFHHIHEKREDLYEEDDRLIEATEDIPDLLHFYDDDDENESGAGIALLDDKPEAETAALASSHSEDTESGNEITANATYLESKKIELYDSGTTKHLSPYTYQKLPKLPGDRSDTDICSEQD
jgi:hypothetical protein